MDVSLNSIPKAGQVHVEVSVTSTVNVSAFAARHKVNRFVMDEISYMLHAEEPTLVVADHLVWRVPVILTLRSHGAVGTVGVIDVDVETGQMHTTPKLVQELNEQAEILAVGAASKTAR